MNHNRLIRIVNLLPILLMSVTGGCIENDSRIDRGNIGSSYKCSENTIPDSLAIYISTDFFADLDESPLTKLIDATSTKGELHIQNVVLPEVVDVSAYTTRTQLLGGFLFGVGYPEEQPSLDMVGYSNTSCAILSKLHERRLESHSSLKFVSHFEANYYVHQAD